MNRKDRRIKGSNTRRVVRATAKANGLTESTVESTSPAFLALKIQSLERTIGNFIKAQDLNTRAIQNAFSMVDMHQQILQRVVRDVARVGAAAIIHRHADGTLNLPLYYQLYRAVAEDAGPEAAELACILWSQGYTPVEAVERAKLERLARKAELGEPQAVASEELDYETEYFGGNNAEKHNIEDSQGAQATG